MIPANDMIDKVIEVFDIPLSPPKGVKKSALNRPRSQLHKLNTFIIIKLYEVALELETRRDEAAMTSPVQVKTVKKETKKENKDASV